jgi:perosamine synthetase
MFQLSSPSLGRREMRNVKNALRSGWLTQNGSDVRDLENSLNEYFVERFTGPVDVTSTSNGTTALHLALLALEVGPGDEVVIPNFCYVAVVNAVLYCGATPVPMDVSEDSWNMEASDVIGGISPRTKAIIVVDNYGRPTDVKSIKAKLPRAIPVIQDSAEAFPDPFGVRNEIHSDLVTLSMYANKILTAGEGGAVVGSPHLIAKISALKNQSQDPMRKFSHIGIGYNYRITNLSAAVFNAQWQRRHVILQKRANIFANYFDLLASAEIKYASNYNENSSPWLFTIMLRDLPLGIDSVLSNLQSLGVESRPGFKTLTSFEYVREKLTTEIKSIHAHHLSTHIVSLPTYSELRQNDLKEIVSRLKRALGE